MDSRKSLEPPPKRHQPHHRYQQMPPGMMMPPNTSTAHQPHHIPNNSNNNNNSIVPHDSIQQRFAFDGSDQCGDESSPPGGPSIEPARKNIGRPRKYSPSPDGHITLGLAPSPVISGGGTPNSDSAAQKHRERPRGSWKKQMDPLGSAGVGFTPHIITVKVGEDIATKITPFTQQGARTVSILSANGAINNVTLYQPAMLSNTVTYKGRFEIISLSGVFKSHGSIIYSCLSVSLAASDGRVLSGIVVGCLVAATPIQVVVGSFIIDTKIPKPLNMRNFGSGPVPGASQPSDGESSNGSGGSPPHQPPASDNNASQKQHQQPLQQ